MTEIVVSAPDPEDEPVRRPPPPPPAIVVMVATRPQDWAPRARAILEARGAWGHRVER